MKREMTQRKCFVPDFLFVTIYGILWSSSVELFTWSDAGLFGSPLLPPTHFI